MAALTVEEATARVLDHARPIGSESVEIARAAGRTLAEPLAALLTQPQFDASAMDGYAARRSDVTRLPAELDVIGEAAAGHAFLGEVQTGQATRIFTGAPVPAGADAIVIQENTSRTGAGSARIVVHAGTPDVDHIRRRGCDFLAGDVLLAAGRRLGPREVTLAAAMGHGRIGVAIRPRVAVLATGDELVLPGTPPAPAEIVASNHLGVMALVEQAGASATFLGIARDRPDCLDRLLSPAGDFDVIVTIGGASVGDHDLVAPALRRRGVALDFWKIAMRPGKPMMLGHLARAGQPTHVLGLPGNPVSALVCTLLFAVPLVRRLQGDPAPAPSPTMAIADADLEPNGERAHYMRANIVTAADGRLLVRPLARQDSSLLSPFADANALLIRPVGAPAALRGAAVPVIRLDI